MSPTKRPSAVAGLQRAVAAPPRVREDDSIGRQENVGRLAPQKPARVTLNLPPELYRQLARWADSAAETIGVPRVGVQETMRAMIRVITGDEAPSCSARVLAELRAELAS